jgi:hemoglobin
MATHSTSQKTLYARLGGYDTIAAIVDEFLQSLSTNPQMARFSASMNLDTRKRNRQLTLDYLAAASGGPTLYLGKDMKPAHAGLGISASDWKSRWIISSARWPSSRCRSARAKKCSPSSTASRMR